MADINVQFSGADQKTIVSVFSCEQDAGAYPNQGVVDDSDERYILFVAPTVTADRIDPIEKLKAFLQANPDVAAILK